MATDDAVPNVRGLFAAIVRNAVHGSPAPLSALCLLDEFDDLSVRVVLPDEDHTTAIARDPLWGAVYDTVAEGCWVTREHLRADMRLLLVKDRERLFFRTVDRLIEAAIGDQLSDPLSLAVWYCRYKMDPIASAGFHALAVEEPALVHECLSIIRQEAPAARIFRSGHARLLHTIGDWLPIYAYLSRQDRPPGHSQALSAIHHEWTDVRSRDLPAERDAPARHDDVSLTAPYVWPVPALVNRSRRGHVADRLRWEPVAVRENLQAFATIARETRRQLDPSTSHEPRKADADSGSALSVSWWRQADTRELVRSASEDVNRLVSALAFPLAEVERATHRIAVVGARTVRRTLVLNLRPSPASESGERSEYAVLWQIPDSAGRAADLEIRGADNLPTQGPSDEAVTALRVVVEQLLRHDLEADHTFGGPRATLIPASYYARLERLLTQTWRVVRMPQSRAERQITVTWTEHIDRRRGGSHVRAVMRGLTMPLQTSGYSPREHYVVKVDTPPDLTVRSLELRVPRRRDRPDLPDYFTDSTLLLRLGPSWAARGYLGGVPMLIGILALLISMLLPDNTDSSRELGSQLSYVFLAAAPAAISILVESRRRSGPTQWALRSLRYVVFLSATLSSLAILFTLIPLDTDGHLVAWGATMTLGIVLIVFGAILTIFYSLAGKT